MSEASHCVSKGYFLSLLLLISDLTGSRMVYVQQEYFLQKEPSKAHHLTLKCCQLAAQFQHARTLIFCHLRQK
jgi:hypothetical protein